MAVSTKIRQAKMLEALKKSLGVVTSACTLAKIPRSTHYTWIEEDSEYKKAVEEISEEAIDFVESSLFLQIKGKNTAATIFYLKTKGKKRGYVERIETVHSGNIPSEAELDDDIQKLTKKVINGK